MDWVVVVTALAWLATMVGVPWLQERQAQSRAEDEYWRNQYTWTEYTPFPHALN